MGIFGITFESTHGDDYYTTLDKLIHNETHLQSPFLAQTLHLHLISDKYNYILLLVGNIIDAVLACHYYKQGRKSMFKHGADNIGVKYIPLALLGGFGGMTPPRIFFKLCNLVRFRVYFNEILSLKT